ncbi:hypothetical protein CWI75_16610 [Kineobactrum sediminis]|uniref:Uncharacterized protein n=1 Tax=Kineobactrum sediminis TaxID=1905677 RepID=A0A2N5XYN2_9GAMM|nr:hypothetical protein [Kineobactrum sediminis]PLW81250.1 hypothetical protein CWI75_16610 [Kineobactrum sediminis]
MLSDQAVSRFPALVFAFAVVLYVFSRSVSATAFGSHEDIVAKRLAFVVIEPKTSASEAMAASGPTISRFFVNDLFKVFVPHAGKKYQRNECAQRRPPACY